MVGMDFDLAITRYREPLLGIVATLFAMVGLSKDGYLLDRLPWRLHRTVLAILRPAESAVRRLIVVAARNMVVKPPPPRKPEPGPKIARKGEGQSRISFKLFDVRKRFDRPPRRTGPRSEPRISSFIDGELQRTPSILPPKEKQDGVNAHPLYRRLLAIQAALEDLTAQAKRYARWRAKPFDQRKPKLASPLRPGFPPGHRKKPSHEVHAILSECHWLAHIVPGPDTS
jgi:hypothetical protein